jgi:hypothetical protein
MRRGQAILVILALLATPLSLLARATAPSPMDCNGMCCLPHGPHHSMPHQTPQNSGHEGISCEHGELGHGYECSMKSGHHNMDYGFSSPIAPTRASAIASIALLNAPRFAGFQSPDQNLSAGFVANPFQPPRS